jgi:hypothetical protein
MKTYTEQFDSVQISEMVNTLLKTYGSGSSDLGTILGRMHLDAIDRIKGLENRVEALEGQKRSWLRGTK